MEISDFRLKVIAQTDLIPGLPDDVVLNCILPRLAWTSFPSLLRISKSWNAAFASRRIGDIHRMNPSFQEPLLPVIRKTRTSDELPLFEGMALSVLDGLNFLLFAFILHASSINMFSVQSSISLLLDSLFVLSLPCYYLDFAIVRKIHWWRGGSVVGFLVSTICLKFLFLSVLIESYFLFLSADCFVLRTLDSNDVSNLLFVS
ncbi:hypothetical protein O6H91_22G068000 [Diphasiastrum complanatum]|uniref:Uncharacterized protein n=1 Tax=Diphasiastrum complanatum TaxID=34168 RepID=A0ACC2AGY5_DIPCM|nr:hypothetical protein O6H91_22G068000 [Diphasiastrum complanatum]